MILFEKAYNFFIGMLIGLFVIYFINKWGRGCDYVEEAVTKMD